MSTNSRPAKQTLQDLYWNREETGDVTFIVESRCIRAHRCILSAVSPKYKAQFFGSNPDKGDINVINVAADAFQEFMEFFYLETVNLTVDNIENVLDLAKQSLVEEFVSDCTKFLLKAVTRKNLCWSYRLAILHNIQLLRCLCEDQISTNASEVFATEDFLQCDREVLLNILKLDTLKCKETEVFNACISWARVACKQKNVDHGKAENLRTELGDAISHIRFSSMTVKEFVVLHKKHKGFFTSDESNEIFYIIGELEDFKPKNFNQKPRKLHIDMRAMNENKVAACGPIIASQLECNRILAENRCNEQVQFRRAEFSCNKSIRFKGFALGTILQANGLKLQISVLRRIHINDEIAYYPKYTVKLISDTETAVTFDKPIDIRSRDRILIIFILPYLTAKAAYSLTDRSDVDGICFSFFGNLLTRIYFDKVNEDE